MRILFTMLVLGLAAGCVSKGGPDVAASSGLVFCGTVTTIENSTIARSRQNWIVTMRVDRIERGQFAGTNFSFRVHSPAKSGLSSNGTYRVEAKATQGGFVVDELHWRK